MMQLDSVQFIIVLIGLTLLGLGLISGILTRFSMRGGPFAEETLPPEWGPTVSAPFRPSDDEISRVPDRCPACGTTLSPYEVSWDTESGEAYCPDCKFPLKRR